MFGYVRPIPELLEEGEKELFSAYYCGVCREMGRRSRMTLTFDCAFLALMLSGGSEAGMETIRCRGNPFRKKRAIRTGSTRYCADLNTILSYYKILDDIADEGKTSRRLMGWLLRGDFRRAAARQPQAALAVERSIAALQRLEEESCPVSDMAADTTASMMAALAGEPDTPLYRLFYHVGRWLYLLDALMDYDEDLERGGYNVLRLEWGSREAAVEAMEFALWHALSVVEEECGRLELTQTALGIVRNTLEKGMAARTHLALYGQEEKEEVGSL